MTRSENVSSQTIPLRVFTFKLFLFQSMIALCVGTFYMDNILCKASEECNASARRENVLNNTHQFVL